MSNGMTFEVKQFWATLHLAPLLGISPKDAMKAVECYTEEELDQLIADLNEVYN